MHGPGLVAGVAAFVFAVDEGHALTAMWLASRNTMLAALFGILAVHAHVRWRSGDSRWFALAGPVLFGLALASGEAGLCSFGYVLGWAMWRDRGRWTQRLATLTPYLALIVAWRIAYVALDFGVIGSSLYLDIEARPLTFLGRALVYPPSLMTAQLSLPVTDLLLIAPAAWIALTLAFGGLVWALAPVLRSDEAQFWLGGSLFAAVPFAATMPTGRLPLILGAGAASIVGLAFAGWREGVFEGRGRRAVIGLILFANVILAPILFMPYGLLSAVLEAPHRAVAEQLGTANTEVAVVLNMTSEINGLYPKAVAQAAGLPWPAHVYTLYAGTDPLEVERVDANTLELYSEAGWAAQPVDRFTRDWRRGFAVGDRVELEHAQVEVLEITADDRPSRVRVRFDRDLDTVAIYGFSPKLERWRPEVGAVQTFKAAVGQG